MDIERLKKDGYFQAYADAYALLKEAPDNATLHTKEYWDSVNRKANEIVRKYAGTPAETMARELVVATLNEIERIYDRG